MSDAQTGTDQDFDRRLDGSGYDLPPAPSAVGVYRTVVTSGNMAYTSGHLPVCGDGSLMKGCVGDGVTKEEGYQAARQCGLAMLVSLKQHLGTLNRIKRVIKLTGMVNSVAGYEDQPAVINGCSELMAEVFGKENGIGARSAVGMSGLPLGVVVEIEGIFELETE